MNIRRSRRWEWLGPIRPVLVRGYNSAHRLAHRASMVVGAMLRGRVERCVVCGRIAPMLLDRRAVDPELIRRWGLSPRRAEALVRKESLACSLCGAKARVRALAEVVLEAFPTGARSVRAWSRTTVARALRVAEVNRVEGLHEALASLPGLRSSDFHDPAAPGSHDASAPHEDLTHLTYADGSFDLVITSETLEHVPDLDAALWEIRRVLVAGGRHVFTVPLLPGVAATFARARLRDGAGGIEPVVEPLIAHPGGSWGYPVFTEFGADLPEILDAAGFDARVHFGPPTEDNLIQVWEAIRRPDR